MIDSTNPRILADNIRALSAKGNTLGDAIEALGSYSTTEFDTGKRWLNDEPIYQRVLTFESSISISYDAFTNTNVDFPDISKIINCFGISSTGGFCGLLAYHASNKVLVQTERNGGTMSLKNIVVEYTKSVSPAALTSPAPDDTRSIEPEVREEEPIIDESIEEPVVEVKKTTRKKTTTTE